MRRLFGRLAVFIALLIFMCVLMVFHLHFSVLEGKQDGINTAYNFDHNAYRSHLSLVQGSKEIPDGRMEWINSKDLNVYIVEEHHAVLKYWFEAARSGLIKEHGNTLVHIDGHSDLAMPFKTAFFPAFRYPKTPLDLEAMMQSNDVFIMGAAISGLFKTVIWIWPSWDKSDHDDIDDVVQFRIGVTTLDSSDPEEYGHTFCLCYKNISTSQEMCVYTPVKGDRENIIDIPKSSCDIHTKLNVLTVEETFGIKTLLSDQIQNDNIVLDIDEDYYGCTLPAQDLVDVGITVSDVQNLNDVLDRIFCPKSVAKELRTDKMLFTALEMLKSDDACKKVARFSKCSGVSRRATVLYYLERESHNLKIRCQHESKKFIILLRKLVSTLSILTATQLTVLQNVGFCISTMFPSNPNLWESTFGVCIGNNVPGESAVFDHPTNSTEIALRTKILNDILKSLKKTNVQITTVCRSVRDGYTPRKHFHLIEKDVLKSLSVLGRQTNLHYDSWLLGGKRGWYNRNKS